MILKVTSISTTHIRQTAPETRPVATLLVLVNRGGATGKEILALAERIVKSVVDKFGVTLGMEAELH